MALKDSFFSKLFGSNTEEEKTVQEADADSFVEQPEIQPDAPAAPIIAPLDDLCNLELPQEHAIHRLWSLRVEQAGWLPSPALRLAAPKGQPEAMAREDLEKELPRLRLAVTTSANQRIAKALPKKEDDAQPSMDAQPVVFLTRDQLTAWVLVYPPVGDGRGLDEAMLDRALREAQVSYGVDQKVLSGLPADRDRYFHLFLVARGTPPVHGKDGGIVDMFQRELKKEVTVDEYDRVDYTALNLVQNVEEGEAICQIIPSLAGTPGTTVLGREIPAKNGKNAAIPKGRNTELNADGSALIATRSGHVEFTGRSFHVKPVLEIAENVDFSTGSINFLGDVHIHGDVCSGFTVRAMGNVMVDGLVEAASVEAGGDLVVARGVVGNGQAVISAQRSVFAKYLENCSIHVRENLQADCIINCDVYCDGVVQVRSGRGTIIGGRIRAAQEVSASIVGSKSERITAIYLGGLPCEDYERERLLQEIQELNEEYDRTDRQPNSPAKKSRMSSLRMKLSVNRLKLEQFDKDMELLGENMLEQEGQRLSGGIVYPGTVVNIGTAMLKVEYETRQCIATLMEGEIYLM